MTEWRPIPQWEDSYEASDDGQIRGIDRWVNNGHGERFVPGVMKSCRIDNGGAHKGYRIVTLCRNSKRIPYPVHSLVYATFIGEIPHGYRIEHKNNDKLDDNADNLHYTPKERNINRMEGKGR